MSFSRENRKKQIRRCRYDEKYTFELSGKQYRYVMLGNKYKLVEQTN
jgi:hypothetical protein